MRPGQPRETRKPRTFTEAARRAQIIEAAIDTIAEVGFGRASLARIGERVGISKGLIGYHFAGKDDLIEQVVLEVLEQGKAYMRPRIVDAMETGSGFLRAYIESNLAFMQEQRNSMVAVVEIERSGLTADGQERFHGRADAIDEAVRVLGRHLAHYQAVGDLRPDFDPNVMASPSGQPPTQCYSDTFVTPTSTSTTTPVRSSPCSTWRPAMTQAWTTASV